MTDQPTINNPLFMSLVLSLQAGAWQQLGKVASPMTGKVERDLQGAKYSIDLLGMLQEKTEGNLDIQEKQMLEHVVYELRMNFVDESKKAEPVAENSTEEVASDSKKADSVPETESVEDISTPKAEETTASTEEKPVKNKE